MHITRRELGTGMLAGIALLPFPAHAATIVDVRDHGARGDGVAIDSEAINAAISAAAARPFGGTVTIPAGRYLCFSIRLKSRVTIQFEPGAIIVAADPALHAGRYDLPEGPELLYQDFGHSHWQNSLIWGDDVHDVAITGPGLIHGLGLTRDGPGTPWKAQVGERPLSMQGMSKKDIGKLEPDANAMRGLGNKAIAFKNGRNIHLSDFTMLKCGHFAILATGTQKLTIRDLSIDSDRDGIDLDCVRDVLVERCRVNTPNDDGIVIKASYALGKSVAAENIVVRQCAVSGFDMGSMLDGTRTTVQPVAPDRDRVTGRIKLGTESNGGYRNVKIEECSFTHCRGLALETVDGGVMENIVAHRLTMQDVTTAPIFLRLGDRRRGPAGTGVGAIRGVKISEVLATGIDRRFAASISGLPGNPVEDVELSDLYLSYDGGGTAAEAALVPPENPRAYPEPSMFGVLPAWGLWMRHARDIRIRGLGLATVLPDQRPAFGVEDVTGLSVEKTPLWRG